MGQIEDLLRVLQDRLGAGAGLDDRFCCHPKVNRATDAAIGLWAKCRSFCRLHGAPGTIALPDVRKLASNPTRARAMANELVSVGLWETTSEDQWRFHDWEYWQARPNESELLGILGSIKSSVDRLLARLDAEPSPVVAVSTDTDIAPATERVSRVYGPDARARMAAGGRRAAERRKGTEGSGQGSEGYPEGSTQGSCKEDKGSVEGSGKVGRNEIKVPGKVPGPVSPITLPSSPLPLQEAQDAREGVPEGSRQGSEGSDLEANLPAARFPTPEPSPQPAPPPPLSRPAKPLDPAALRAAAKTDLQRQLLDVLCASPDLLSDRPAPDLARAAVRIETLVTTRLLPQQRVIEATRRAVERLATARIGDPTQCSKGIAYVLGLVGPLSAPGGLESEAARYAIREPVGGAPEAAPVAVEDEEARRRERQEQERLRRQREDERVRAQMATPEQRAAAAAAAKVKLGLPASGPEKGSAK